MEYKKEKSQNKHTYIIGRSFSLRKKLQNLLYIFENILVIDFKDIKIKKPLYYYDINTGSAKPIYQKAHPIPLAYREWLKMEIKEMEESGIIKEASSPSSSPIVLVLKKGSQPGEFTPRLCTDY